MLVYLSLFYFLFYSFFRPRVLYHSISVSLSYPIYWTTISFIRSLTLTHPFICSFSSSVHTHRAHIIIVVVRLVAKSNQPILQLSKILRQMKIKRLLRLLECCVRFTVCNGREQKSLFFFMNPQSNTLYTQYRVKWSTDLSFFLLLLLDVYIVVVARNTNIHTHYFHLNENLNTMKHKIAIRLS